jgi:hypothetical protein
MLIVNLLLADARLLIGVMMPTIDGLFMWAYTALLIKAVATNSTIRLHLTIASLPHKRI